MNQRWGASGAGRVRMVDVGDKPPVRRVALATGEITLSRDARALVARHRMKKGNVLAVAQIAGIQAAKRTSELIPLCHPVPLDHVEVNLRLTSRGVAVEAGVRTVARTGVEMEALTAVSMALLTVYDMCKAVDSRMRLGNIRLLSKEKGDVPIF